MRTGDTGAAAGPGGGDPGPLAAVLIGASRLLRPVLAGSAIVALLIIVPGRSPHPAIRTARVFLGDAVGVRAEWLRWSLLQEHPAPAELILRLPELPTPLAGTAP